MIVNGVSGVGNALGVPKIARRLGIEPEDFYHPSKQRRRRKLQRKFNRRLGVFTTVPKRRTLISTVTGWGMGLMHKIPQKHYIE